MTETWHSVLSLIWSERNIDRMSCSVLGLPGVKEIFIKHFVIQ